MKAALMRYCASLLLVLVCFVMFFLFIESPVLRAATSASGWAHVSQYSRVSKMESYREAEENDASTEMLAGKSEAMRYDDDVHLSDEVLGFHFEDGVHLISTFFRKGYSKTRFKEVLRVLEANLSNRYITRVHILWEDESPRPHIHNSTLLAKLITVKVEQQPMYSTMFRYANTVLGRGTVAMISNADIYFDDSLSCIRPVKPDDLDPETGTNLYDQYGDDVSQRPLYALSRRPSPECGAKKDHWKVYDLCLDYQHSHDTFVFAPPVSETIIEKLDHPQNRNGAENVVIFEFQAAHYATRNPCKQIKGYHLHCTKERHYKTGFIDGTLSNTPKSERRHGRVAPGIIKFGTGNRDIKVAPTRCNEIVY